MVARQQINQLVRNRIRFVHSLQQIFLLKFLVILICSAMACLVFYRSVCLVLLVIAVASVAWIISQEKAQLAMTKTNQQNLLQKIRRATHQNVSF